MESEMIAYYAFLVIAAIVIAGLAFVLKSRHFKNSKDHRSAILRAIMRAQKPCSANDMKDNRVHGLAFPGQGAIYPLLRKMERDGDLSVVVSNENTENHNGRPRYLYSITPHGAEDLGYSEAKRVALGYLPLRDGEWVTSGVIINLLCITGGFHSAEELMFFLNLMIEEELIVRVPNTSKSFNDTPIFMITNKGRDELNRLNGEQVTALEA